MSKIILAAGCSFTDADNSWTNIECKDESNNIECHQIARSSSSNSRIAESVIARLIGYNPQYYDKVIIQWSAVGRSYAMNEQQLIDRLVTEKNSFALEYLFKPDEYISYEKDQYQYNLWGVTDVYHVVSSHLYKSALLNMLLCKYALDALKVDYVMYWGWQQINEDLAKSYKKYLDCLYSKNFILFDGHGGMQEYAVAKLGEKTAIKKEDLHPTRAAHKLWFDNVLKPIIFNQRKFGENLYEIT